jgi:hypothetical protein
VFFLHLLSCYSRSTLNNTFSQDTETEYANLELGNQKEYAAESDQRRLRLMEEEGYAAHHHGKSLTQDALSNINNSQYYFC